jgi:uncharacterized membrane protein
MTRATASYISTYKRFWEIDLVRTVAILGLLTFHTHEVLYYFDLVHNPLRSGIWFWIRVANCGLFVFPAGVALTISNSRRKGTASVMLRGLKLLGLGMAITLLSLLVVQDEYVRFGILHFFGIAFILAPLFLRFRYINLILGTAVMAIGIYLLEQRIFVDSPWLLWLVPYAFRTVTLDYWPLVPWFGLFLLGMFAGKMLYPDGNRGFNIPEISNPVASAVMLLGRHPLLVYLAHLPILIGIMSALFPDKILPQIREVLSYLPF